MEPRRVAVHFFHVSTNYVRSGAWRSVRAGFMGGGDLFMTAIYDERTHQIVSLQANGPM